MAKKKLLEDIKANPSRFYRLPADVVRDRRFDDGERLEILQAWAGEAGPSLVGQIGDLIADVRRRLARNDHAAE